MVFLKSVDLLPASVNNVTSKSISLNWDQPPPELTGDLQRTITQYAVTVTPEDGDPLDTVVVPAEAGTVYTIDNLTPDTAYDIQISVVIDTERQGEETFDIGAPSLSATTCKINAFLPHYKLYSHIFL